jgi:PAS domain S-box-containing protein
MKTPRPNPDQSKADLELQGVRKWVEAVTLNQQIVADLMEGVVVMDRGFRCIVWNAFMENLSGISAENLQGRNPLHASAALISFLQEIGVYGGVERALQGDSVSCPDKLYAAPAGKPVWLAGRCSPLRDIKHEIIAVIVTLRDITDHKRSEGALRRKGAELEEAQRLAQVASWNWDVMSDTITWSNELFRISGRDPTLLAPSYKEHSQLFTAESWSRLSAAMDRALRTGSPYEVDLEMVRVDGSMRSIAARGEAVRDASSRVVQLRGTIQDITDRKRNEERFRMAAQAGKMFAYDWDIAKDVVVCSGESAQILGIDEGTLITGQELLSNVHPGDQERLTVSIAALSPEKPYLRVSNRRVRPDSTVIWVERTGRAYFDDKGRTLRIIGMVADITERKLAERELALANDRLRLAMDSAKSVGWDRDVKTGRDTLFGDLQSMLGIPSEVHDGRVEDFYRYLHPNDRGWVLDAIKDAMERKEPYAAEFRIVRPDGTARWVAARGKFYYSTEGEPERMVGMSVDITERKLAEEALRESEERLRLAAQVGRMFAFDWDIATDVVIRSEEATHIDGLTSEPFRLTYQQVLASVHPEDRARFIASITELTPEKPNTQASFRILRPDGSILWLERTGHAYFDEQGKMVRMIGMTADVTERKLAEEALSKVGGRLIEAHEEERTRIARELHDDIGQQLALLANNLALMEQDIPDSVTEIRNRVSEQLKRVHGISADVQAISHRLHSSKLRYLGIVAAAKSFCQELAEQHKVEVDFTHADIPPSVPEEISLCLFRVMQEALHNAVKHSGVRHIEVELRGASDGIHLTVRDSGLGFDPEAAVSDRGLGLVSMQERVNLVKGTFSIDSRPGHGTTIHVRVPLSSGKDAMRAGA